MPSALRNDVLDQTKDQEARRMNVVIGLQSALPGTGGSGSSEY